MLTFNKNYATICIAIFAVEVFIALFVEDSFVRPFVGDTLVVVLIYCFLLSVFKLPRVPAAASVLLFAFAVETLQYFKFVNLIGLGENLFARVVIGTTFSVLDLVAYTAGFAAILFFEKILQNKSR